MGYSTKARGIAKDLGQEQWVLNVTAMSKEILCDKYWQLNDDKDAIKDRTKNLMDNPISGIGLI